MALKINNTNYAPIVLDLSTKELIDGTITSIETNVTTISPYAFFNCTELVSVVAANATSVGENAFYGCSKLETVDLRNCVTIGNNAFNGCTKLKTIIVSDKLTNCASNLLGTSGTATDRKVIFISDDAAKWTQINFTKDICIHNYRLYHKNTRYPSLNEYMVTSIELSPTMATMNAYSVEGLGLTTFSAIYDNQIPAGAFGLNNNITSLNLSNNGLDCVGKYFDNNVTYLTQNNNYYGARKVKHIRICSDVKPQFCYGLTNLARVELASNDTTSTASHYTETIGAEAFMGCTGLSMLTLPNTLHTIGNDAFKNCFTNATVQSGSYPLHWNPSIVYIGSQYSTSTTYGWGKISFGNEYSNPAYAGRLAYNADNSVNVGSTMRVYASTSDYNYYGYGTYHYSYFTEYIASNNTVTANIDDYAFYGQYNLATIDLSTNGNITSIGTYAFAKCGVSTLTFGSNITSIPEHCFDGCPSLTTLDLSSLPSNVSIGQYAFANSAIATLTLGSNITRIPSYCFLNCPITSALTIGSNIAEIEPYAFKQESSTPPYISSLTIDDAFMNSNTNKIWYNSFSGARARTVTTPNIEVLKQATDFYGTPYLDSEPLFDSNFKRVESIYFTTSPNVNNIGMIFEQRTLKDLTYLTSLSVPKFDSIVYNPMSYCNKLTEMTYRGTSSEFIAALRKGNRLPSSEEDTNYNYLRYFCPVKTVHCTNTTITKPN